MALYNSTKVKETSKSPLQMISRVIFLHPEELALIIQYFLKLS